MNSVATTTGHCVGGQSGEGQSENGCEGDDSA
jgi:hypothetical protein